MLIRGPTWCCVNPAKGRHGGHAIALAHQAISEVALLQRSSQPAPRPMEGVPGDLHACPRNLGSLQERGLLFALFLEDSILE